MYVNCFQCKNSFKISLQRSRHKHFFCCMSCYKLFQSQDKERLVKKTCKNCNKEFYEYKSRANNNCGVYCSKTCYSSYIKKPEINCLNCGKSCKDFNGKNRKRKYCSLECSYRKKVKQGYSSPISSTGIGIFKRFVREADNKICFLCSSEKNIEIHHKDGNRKNNYILNWIPLCCICHNRIHHLSKKLSINLVDALAFFKENHLYKLNTKQYRLFWIACPR